MSEPVNNTGTTPPSGSDPSDGGTTPPPRRFDWLGLIVLVTLAAVFATALSAAAIGLRSLQTPSTPPSHSPSSQAPACSSPNVSVETTEEGVRTCLTPQAFSTYTEQAQIQYQDSLTRGRTIYGEWLTKHELSPKSDKARAMIAQGYICKSWGRFGDGALYAATQAGIEEYQLTIAIDDKLITIAGYDPQDVYCVNGKPGKPTPSPSLPPKNPRQDPSVNGMADKAGGTNQPPSMQPRPSASPTRSGVDNPNTDMPSVP